MRAIAVLSVLIFHVFPQAMPGGFIGVDIFFVISGFLISGIVFDRLEQGSFSYAEFYTRRIKRIFPALLLVMTACCIAGWFLLFGDEYQQLGKHVAAGAAFISNFVLWGESGYFDNAAETKPLLHLWSLGIEEQFYIVWPVVIWALWRLRANVLMVLATAMTVSFVFNLHLLTEDTTAAFYSPLSRAWELMAGSILAYCNRYRPLSWQVSAESLSVSGLVLLLCGFILIDRSAGFPGYWALMPVLGTVMMIAAGPEAILNRHLLSNQWLVRIGLISYPVYLWHWPIISYFRITQKSSPGLLQGLLIIALSLLLAWLTYRYVESSVRKSSNGGRLACLLLAAMLALGVLGYKIYEENGWEFRQRLQGDTDHPPPYNLLRKQVLTSDALGQLNRERNIARRWPMCNFSHRGDDHPQRFSRQLANCLVIDEAKPNVLVYGDSHAADLWYSLASQFDRINFLQATASGCFPGRDEKEVRPENTGCQQLTGHMYEHFDFSSVDLVLINARWRIRSDRQRLLEDIAYLQSRGAHIVLVGPMFEYVSDLHGILRRGDLPDGYLNPGRFELDRTMSAYFQRHGVPYFSKIDQLCKNQSCLWNDGEKVLIYDYGHMTRHGMTVFGKKYRAAGLIQKHLEMKGVYKNTIEN